MNEYEYFEDRISWAAKQLRKNFEKNLVELAKELSRDPRIKEFLINEEVLGAKIERRRRKYLEEEIYEYFEGLFG